MISFTRLKTQPIIAGALLLAGSALSQSSSQPPDPRAVSYAFGLNLGIQIKQMGAEVDINTIVQAMKDVQDGKPTKLQASDLPSIFKQEEDFARSKIAAKNKAEGEAFLAKNAASPGITVLPDGLQYRVLQPGTGAAPNLSDIVTLKYRGTLTDGTEFDHSDHLQTSIAAQMKGWQEALPLMKAGSKWQIFLPPNLAYGRNWLRKVGPESTVVFEIELVSVDPPSVQTDGPRAIPQ